MNTSTALFVLYRYSKIGVKIVYIESTDSKWQVSDPVFGKIWINGSVPRTKGDFKNSIE